MTNLWKLAAGLALLSTAGQATGPDESDSATREPPFLVVLGVAQDAGYPQAGTPPGPIWETLSDQRLAASLGLVDPHAEKRWMFEATPDFKVQLHRLDVVAPAKEIPGLDGIFLTHGHMGHYTGLVHLGREVIGAHRVPVWAMPRMRTFLSENGPWEQLVRLQNITLRSLEDGKPVELNPGLTVTPIEVPHRDEYTETVGYVIAGPKRSALFIPDIDKWERWDAVGTRVEEWIERVDVAYLDGSFFADGEIPGRAISEIPHPFIEESLARFSQLPHEQRDKVRFIHLNRTNPALDPESPEAQLVRDAGCHLAVEGERFSL